MNANGIQILKNIQYTSNECIVCYMNYTLVKLCARAHTHTHMRACAHIHTHTQKCSFCIDGLSLGMFALATGHHVVRKPRTSGEIIYRCSTQNPSLSLS